MQETHPSSRWRLAASLLWAAVLVVLILRAGLHPARPTSLTTYLTGGSTWLHLRPLYTNWRGFIYPPPAAWFFSLLARMPVRLAAILWRVLAAGTFLAGLAALLRSCSIPPSARGLVFIAALPLSIGNIDNAQANPLIAGLMMLAVGWAAAESWTLCALAAGLATLVKVYPIALALLLGLLFPRRFSWRFLLALILLATSPYLLQDHAYVSGQYHAWLQSRLADDRFHYPMKDAPLDLWYLLVRLGSLPIPPRAYILLQLAAGAAIAARLLILRRRGLPPPSLLEPAFLMVSVWMLLLGPATENQTYVVLAPAAAILFVQAFAAPFPPPARAFAAAGFALLLAAAARNSLAPHLKSPLFMAIQPLGALLLIPALLAIRPTTPPAPTSPQ